MPTRSGLETRAQPAATAARSRPTRSLPLRARSRPIHTSEFQVEPWRPQVTRAHGAAAAVTPQGPFTPKTREPLQRVRLPPRGELLPKVGTPPPQGGARWPHASRPGLTEASASCGAAATAGGAPTDKQQ